jgi:3-deoxy-D-manno-octulosonate 8-phosphate phosphatase (KDO 8-P phosphatase)
MKMLQRTGVELGVITGRSSQVVALRMESLGVTHVFQGQLDKLPAYLALRQRLALADEHIAFVGDDVVDLPIMVRAGLAVAVADAHPLVQRHAHWQTRSRGGRGAARDVCELIMNAQGRLQQMIAEYVAT